MHAAEEVANRVLVAHNELQFAPDERLRTWSIERSQRRRGDYRARESRECARTATAWNEVVEKFRDVTGA